jgi:hypothetical protein
MVDLRNGKAGWRIAVYICRPDRFAQCNMQHMQRLLIECW